MSFWSFAWPVLLALAVAWMIGNTGGWLIALILDRKGRPELPFSPLIYLMGPWYINYRETVQEEERNE